LKFVFGTGHVFTARLCQQRIAVTGKNPPEVSVTIVTGVGLRGLYVLSSSIHREEIKYHVDATDSISMINTPIHMVLGIIHCGSETVAYHENCALDI
jgi:superfamily II DNA helicase RecQ